MRTGVPLRFFAIIQELILFILIFVLHPSNAQAYPEFIGYGYSSCITCHYNGNGGGALNDYGRALWSTEISSRAIFAKSTTDEKLGEQSGFFGSLQTPDWLRPHVDYRGLELDSSPGSSQSIKKYFTMQEEFGNTFQFDPDGKYLASITWGRVIPAADYGLGKDDLDRFLATEYYARVEIVKTWWLYVGLMEKVFGLRNIDHTSYQRTYQGFNEQNDTPDGSATSQGVILQKIEDKWEVSLNYFIGNPYDSANFKQKGASGYSEFEIGERKRIGASFITEDSEVLKKSIGAAHYRQGLAKGSALLAEFGVIKDEPTGSNATVGSYGMLQSMISMTRGYNLLATVEHYNQEFKSTSPDNWKWGLSVLAFPLPRLEMRLGFVDERQIQQNQAENDSWSILGQFHVSL